MRSLLNLVLVSLAAISLSLATSLASAASGKVEVPVSSKLYVQSVFLNATDGFTPYRIWTDTLSTGSDTVVHLLDSSYHEIAVNDDCTAGAACPSTNALASLIPFVPTTSAFYIVVVRSFNNGRQGDTTTLKIEQQNVRVSGQPDTYTSISTRTFVPVGGNVLSVPVWSNATERQPTYDPNSIPTTTYSTVPLDQSFNFMNLRDDIATIQAGEAASPDTHMFALIGGTIQAYDDDGGAGLAARLSMATTVCPSQCSMLVGGFVRTDSTEGKARLVYDQPPRSYLGDSSPNDTDKDGLTDWLEAIIGTSTTNADTDSDSLNDATEVYGRATQPLPWYGSDPAVKDTFVQLNYMAGVAGNPALFLRFQSTVISNLRDAFTRHGTSRFHLDVAGQIPATSFIDNSPATPVPPANTTNFDTLQNAGTFVADRAGLFRWVVVGYQYTGGGGSSGFAYTGNRFVVTLAGNPGTAGVGESSNNYSGTTAHEGGHTFGLGHNGNGNNPPGTGPNSLIHRSVMSYRYQLAGVPANVAGDSPWRYATDSGTFAAPTCLTLAQALTSPKQQCITAPSATCDCTWNEWLTLDYSGSGLVAGGIAGASGSGLSDVVFGIGGGPMYRRADIGAQFSKSTDVAAYHAGRLATLRALEALLSPDLTARIGAAKRDYLASRGLVEGRDFVIVNGHANFVEAP